VIAPQELRGRTDAVLELHEDGLLVEALEACDAVVELGAGADPNDPVVRESLLTLRFERALLLTELGDLPAAADAYGEAAATPSDLDDPDQRHEVAMALLNRGICFEAIGEGEHALASYDQLVERFGGAADPVTRDQVLRGRVNRAAALLAADRWEEALHHAEELAAELDPVDVLEAEQLAMVVRVRGAALRALGRLEEAVRSLAAAERCTDEDAATRAQVAATHRERAELLAELGRADEAMELLAGAVERFADDPDPAVLEVVADLRGMDRQLRGSHDR
jgi:tetratricopeptide (TPR) repeat protein